MVHAGCIAACSALPPMPAPSKHSIPRPDVCRGSSDSAAGDMRWSKWSFWLLHSLAAVVLYAAIVLLPFTRWRDALPAKPSFYRYVLALLAVYVVMAVGAILIGSKLLAGYCIYGAANFIYYACYAPLLYWTFLAEFFSDEQMDLDLMYYSEMRDAGWFDDEGGL